MGDVITLAVDRLDGSLREELYLALLTYAGPPPTERTGSYVDWCKLVERGAALLYPHWGAVDILDATIQFRHWCCKRGAKQRRRESTKQLIGSIINQVRRVP